LKQSQKKYNRIVVKIGSSLLCANNNTLDLATFESICRQVISLVADEGKEIIIVSSGAIALGMHVLGLSERPRELAKLQAVAAIGQNELMNLYRNTFKSKGCFAAQILLTWEDFSDRKRYLNARNTLFALIEYRKYRASKPIPIINENDTISTEEIRFGDNDRLSALVATLINADLLLILSDVDGLLDRSNNLIRLVSEISSEVKALACPTNKKSCVGGMITKLEAAKIVMDSGIHCIIANGRKKHIVLSAVENPGSSGTLFVPEKELLGARERWLAFGTKPKAKIMVDDGAKEALLKGKSLLCVGVLGAEGHFENKDVVSIIDRQKREIARGKANISDKELEKVKGQRWHKEAVHCDNIAIL
jgi:glutamate 5-kinase